MNPFPSVRSPSILADATKRSRVLCVYVLPFVLASMAALSWKGSAAGATLGAVALAFAGAAAFETRSLRQVRRWVAFSRPVAETGTEASRTVDLGVGEGCRLFGQDGSHPYRGAGGVYLTGDAVEALRRLWWRTLTLSALAFITFATALAAGSYFSRARVTVWPLAFRPVAHSSWWPATAPTLFDVDGDLVKDMIEVERGGDRPRAYNDATVISVINSSTGFRERILPTEKTPSDLLGGRVFTTFRSKLFFVRAENARTGTELWQTPLDIAHDETPEVFASRMRVYLVLRDRVVLLDAATGDELGTIR